MKFTIRWFCLLYMVCFQAGGAVLADENSWRALSRSRQGWFFARHFVPAQVTSQEWLHAQSNYVLSDKKAWRAQFLRGLAPVTEGRFSVPGKISSALAGGSKSFDIKLTPHRMMPSFSEEKIQEFLLGTVDVLDGYDAF